MVILWKLFLLLKLKFFEMVKLFNLKKLVFFIYKELNCVEVSFGICRLVLMKLYED